MGVTLSTTIVERGATLKERPACGRGSPADYWPSAAPRRPGAFENPRLRAVPTSE